MLPFKSKQLYKSPPTKLSFHGHSGFAKYRLDDSPVLSRKAGGLNPKIWGPNFWYVIHISAANYIPSKEAAMAFRSFISSLAYLLPCDWCRVHIEENLKKVPLTAEVLRSNEALLKWSYDFHDTVNQMLGKVSPPFETIRSYYMNPPCSKCVV